MTHRRHIVISSYATLDYVVAPVAQFNGLGTIAARIGLSGAWPRAGGAAYYAARAIASAGHRAAPLCSIGQDEAGGTYRRRCAEAGADVAAIASAPNTSTAKCLLIYQPEGDYGCLLDTGSYPATALNDTQVAAIKAADFVTIAAAPAAITRAILTETPPDTPMGWIVKCDADCFPNDLRRTLSRRASYIFCNGSERDFFSAYLPLYTGEAGPTIIETHGSQSIRVSGPIGQHCITVNAMSTHDTTGAGDTLAGGFIAYLADHDFCKEQRTILAATAAGSHMASTLLQSRRH